MDESKVKIIVKREFKRYQQLLGLPHWTFDFRYQWIGDGNDWFLGRSYADSKYNTATIELNIELLEDEEAIVKTLRHEMLHVIHAEFATYRSAMEPLVTVAEFKSLNTVYSSCCEKTVKQLEFLMTGMKIPLLKPKPKKKKRKR